MKEIKLTQGKVAFVDDEDFEPLSRYKWQATKCCGMWYARTTFRVGGKQCRLYMHRVILGLFKSDILCDHKDRNSLNNQRNNLRPCTRTQNQSNKSKKKNGTSKYKGLTKTRSGSWLAQISHKNKTIKIGLFKDEEKGALAYNKKALELQGEFALINIIS